MGLCIDVVILQGVYFEPGGDLGSFLSVVAMQG